MAKSKICVQFQGSVDWAKDVVVGGLQDYSLLINPPTDDPFDGLVRSFARCWIGGDGIEQYFINGGAKGAELYFERCLPFYRARPYVHAWQGPNEPYTETIPARSNLVSFTLRWCELMAGAGLLSVAGAFSNGTPNIEKRGEIEQLAPMFYVADYNMVHQYSAPTMQTGAEWYTLRHRRLYQMLREITGKEPRPLIIGETGIDGGAIGNPEKGWKTYCSSAEQYLNQIAWLDDELASDPEVIAAFLFTAAANNQWRNFDLPYWFCTVLAQYTKDKWVEAPLFDPSIPRVGGALDGQFPPENTEGESESVPISVDPSGIIMPIANTEKAWYSADERFGPYDGHPNRARDWNLETGGNTDLKEPIVAPTDGTVVFSGNLGGLHGIVVSFVAVVNGRLVNWHWKHLWDSNVDTWQTIQKGAPIGRIGNADGKYSAHLHEEIVLDAITAPWKDWRDEHYNYVDPAAFYKSNGVPASQVNRMVRYDGK